MPELVRITDVSPRDGLQNEKTPVPTDVKADLVDALIRARVDEVEVTSFVSPKWIPQLADAEQLLKILRDRAPKDRPIFSALVPNDKGLKRAIDLIDDGCPLDKVAVFTAASETFSQRNTNATIDETIERFQPVADLTRQHDLATRAYISCVIACPYEGPIAPASVARVTEQLLQLGFDEIDLGDTIGAATPETMRQLLEAVMPIVDGRAALTLHLHDTFGNAGACVRTALELGVRSFDSAVGGLGGCPYASTRDERAPGNIDTQLLIDVVRQSGFETNVHDVGLADAARIAGDILQAPPSDPPLVSTSDRDGVRTITLNRADKRNALTPEMLSRLDQQINDATNDDAVEAILLAGAGNAFCAGFDLLSCRDNDAILEVLIRGLSLICSAIKASPKPVVVAAHGAAIAGGCAIVAAADIVVADENAKLGYPVVALGISPAVSAPALIASTTPGNARARLLDPSVIDGREARRIGLVHEVVTDRADVLPAAQRIAAALADKPTMAIAVTKKWLNELDGSTDEEAIRAATEASTRLVGSDEQRELLARLWADR